MKFSKEGKLGERRGKKSLTLIIRGRAGLCKRTKKVNRERGEGKISEKNVRVTEAPTTLPGPCAGGGQKRRFNPLDSHVRTYADARNGVGRGLKKIGGRKTAERHSGPRGRRKAHPGGVRAKKQSCPSTERGGTIFSLRRN